MGDGWYRGHLANFSGPSRNNYGHTLTLLCQLEIQYANGRSQIITSNPDWRATTKSPIHYSDIYMRERYDARREQPGWATADFDAAAWGGVRIFEGATGQLVAQTGTAVRPQLTLKPEDEFI